MSDFVTPYGGSFYGDHALSAASFLSDLEASGFHFGDAGNLMPLVDSMQTQQMPLYPPVGMGLGYEPYSGVNFYSLPSAYYNDAAGLGQVENGLAGSFLRVPFNADFRASDYAVSGGPFRPITRFMPRTTSQYYAPITGPIPHFNLGY